MARISKQVSETIQRAENAFAVWATYQVVLTKDFQWLIQTEVPGTEVLLSEKSEIDLTKIPAYLYLEQQVALLKQRLERLKAIDEKVFRELGEDRQVVDNRDKTVGNTRQGTFRFQNASKLFYGDPFLELVGLDGETPDNPFELERRLKAALKVLQELEKPPVPLNPDLPFWPVEELEKQLIDLITPLERDQNEVRRETKETQEAQIERRDLLQKTKRALVAINASLETVARLVEKGEIADRIRLPGGRKGRQEVSTDDPGPQPPQPPQNP